MRIILVRIRSAILCNLSSIFITTNQRYLFTEIPSPALGHCTASPKCTDPDHHYQARPQLRPACLPDLSMYSTCLKRDIISGLWDWEWEIQRSLLIVSRILLRSETLELGSGISTFPIPLSALQSTESIQIWVKNFGYCAIKTFYASLMVYYSLSTCKLLHQYRGPFR